MRAALSGQVRELVFPAGSAAGTGLIRRDLSALISPYIERQKRAPERLIRTNQKFYGFSRRDRSGQIYRRIKNSRRLAGFKSALRRISENTCQTCGLAW